MNPDNSLNPATVVSDPKTIQQAKISAALDMAWGAVMIGTFYSAYQKNMAFGNFQGAAKSGGLGLSYGLLSLVVGMAGYLGASQGLVPPETPTAVNYIAPGMPPYLKIPIMNAVSWWYKWDSLVW